MENIQAKKLVRQLAGIDVFCIAVGAMISSGLFVLPGLVYAEIGPSVILAYILAGVFVCPSLLIAAELITAMPRAGGSYFFIERSMGSIAGTIGGFASWFSLSLKSAFSLVGIGAFATLVSPGISNWQIKAISAGFCILFTILNLLSVKSTGRAQIFLVILLIISLLLYSLRGFMLLDINKYTPLMQHGRSELFAATGMVFVSFGGLTKVGSIAEEIKNPGKTAPIAMILGYFTIVLIYGLTIFVTVGLLDKGEFANSLTPISTGGQKIFGTAGSIIMGIAGIFACISTANAGILAASRFPMAMSRDQLLPSSFSKVNRRFNTPHLAIIITGSFMLAIILFLRLDALVKVASSMMIVLFMSGILACIIMRESKILNYKPAFVSPLYPWLHIAGLAGYSFLLYQIGNIAFLAIGAFILISIIWHRFYIRDRATRKSGLLYIVERAVARDMVGPSLDNELRDILRDRDNIVEDRFDKLATGCEVLDIGKPVTHIEFFTIVAEKLAGQLGLNKEEMLNSFIEREQEATTAIRPGLAIPHVPIDGEGKFELLLARCQAGITFPETPDPVYAAFVLVGSRDERNFHLRALSAIAQITQDANFDKDWLRAKNIDELRDIVLLAKRRRQDPRS